MHTEKGKNTVAPLHRYAPLLSKRSDINRSYTTRAGSERSHTVEDNDGDQGVRDAVRMNHVRLSGMGAVRSICSDEVCT